jgi:hypothetical protein
MAAAAAPASAAAVRGLNLNQACLQQYASKYFLSQYVYAALVWPNSAYNWRCFNGPQYNMGGINMNAACQAQYPGSPGAYLAYPFNAYSWRCH